MTRKTFVLGLGAPKSGTTWLHRYIDALPVSNMGCRKEYRIWDAYYRHKTLKSRFDFNRLVQLRYGMLLVPDLSQLVRLRMFVQPGFYERYFAELVDGRAWMTGDISPSYMTLSAHQMRAVAERLRAVGFQVKVVFLMRDPVERCWSGARMRKRNRQADFDGLSDTEAVRAIYRLDGVTARTRYDRTIAAVEQAFDTADVHMALYEELFTPAEIDRLSAFLGVPADHGMADTRVNRTEKEDVLDPGLVDEIKLYFRNVYAVCHDRFPQTRALWS